MSGTVTTVGEILVEMMSTTPGEGFFEAQTILGPYPSGAPAIFIDQIARLGVPASIVGSVGDDDFGQVNIRRLHSDGVDTGSINVSEVLPTAIAFVRYRHDGARDFVFTLTSSAAAEISTKNIDAELSGTDYLHVVGSSLSMASVAHYVKKAIPLIKARGGSISFDPNVRPEIMQDPAMAERLAYVLDQADLLLPSEGELALLCNTESDLDAIAMLLDKGTAEVVLKRGSAGASRHTCESTLENAGFSVTEVDPTGAGDCFGAAYIGCRRLGHSPESALQHACAAGALAVCQQGPMEGASTLARIEEFIEQQPSQDH